MLHLDPDPESLNPDPKHCPKVSESFVYCTSIYLNMYMEKMRLTRTTQVQNT
jgi:hypothetical protein